MGDEAFSTHELNTINSIVKTAIDRSIREELLPSLQEIITNQLQLQLSQPRFQTVSPEPPVIEAPAIEAPAIEPPAIEPPAIERPAIERPASEPPLSPPPPAVEQPPLAYRQLPPPAIEQPPLAYRQLPPRLGDYEYPYFDRQLPPSPPKLENTGLFKPLAHTYLPEPLTYEGKYLVYHDVFYFIDALRLSTKNVCING
jgi:hypothetical protein